MKHLAILTSGGDAPGMNAAIRAVVRTAVYDGVRISAVYRGYQGLIENDIVEVGARSVANIIQRGGTILRTARSEAFMEPGGRARAADNLRSHDIDGLIVIGGDGSFRGAYRLFEEHGFPVVGIPATIDNDIYGTDVSIGFNTAINIALDAVDRLRDTAASHDRCSWSRSWGATPATSRSTSGSPVGRRRCCCRRCASRRRTSST